MNKITAKLTDWKERLRDRHMYSVVVVLILIASSLGIFAYAKQREFRQVMENQYNMAFFELVDYVQNVETLLAKALISKSPEHGAETLTEVWREANLAQASLTQLPFNSNELSNTSKFLNQVSDYSFALSRKNIYKEELSEEDLKNIKELYEYSLELEKTLDQLSIEMNEGRIKWGELKKGAKSVFAQQVSNISSESFDKLSENIAQYAGLIYDGAFSEHMNSVERKGLTGEDIDEETAKNKAIEFVGSDNIENINSNGLNEGDIHTYTFEIKLKNNKNKAWIGVTKKGGHVLYMNRNKTVDAEIKTDNEANEIGKAFLKAKGYENMKETYFLKEAGIITINYAYNKDGVVMYPDLIKVKIALDNGEILGIETQGYLNCHFERNNTTPTISIEQAKTSLNKDLNILSENLAIIPTQFKTEILCWEFKGRIDEKEFLIYINAENGREENILVIVDTPNGKLTM